MALYPLLRLARLLKVMWEQHLLGLLRISVSVLRKLEQLYSKFNVSIIIITEAAPEPPKQVIPEIFLSQVQHVCQQRCHLVMSD